MHKNENHPVICVYVELFSDVAKVKNLREDLGKIGGDEQVGFSFASWDLRVDCLGHLFGAFHLISDTLNDYSRFLNFF